MFPSLRWRILIAVFGFTFLGISIIFSSVSLVMRQVTLQTLEVSALAQARLIGESLSPLLITGESKAALLNAIQLELRLLDDAQVVLINPTGEVLADYPALQNPQPVSIQPEVQQALRLFEAVELRDDPLSGQATLYAAVPLRARGQLLAVLQLVTPASQLAEAQRQINAVFLGVYAGGLILALLVGSWLINQSVRPLRALTHAAAQIIQIPNAEPPPSRRDEVNQLTQAFNRMAYQIRSQMEAQRIEQNKLNAVLTQMSDGVLIADSSGQVLLFNPAAGHIFNFDPLHALGNTLVEVLRDHRLVELWQNCSKSRQEQVIYLEFYKPSRFIQCTATPLDDFLPGGTLMIFQDLTRIRRLETVRRDFISNISHELRTPLASLKALTETLMDSALDDPPNARRFIKRIETEVDALTHMVSELLELSRIESGRVPLQLRATHPKDLLVPAHDRLAVQAERGQLKLVLTYPPDLPQVLADPPRMQQVLVNLLHNAIKFTPPGGTIQLSAQPGEGTVTFQVRDSGVGISAEDLPRIFERFYKADRARSGGGTGLGLAISRHLVEAHGGRIWVESTEGRGSTFSFTLLVV